MKKNLLILFLVMFLISCTESSPTVQNEKPEEISVSDAEAQKPLTFENNSTKEESDETKSYLSSWQVIINGVFAGNTDCISQNDVLYFDVEDINIKLCDNWKFEYDPVEISYYIKDNGESVYFFVAPGFQEFLAEYQKNYGVCTFYYGLFEENESIFCRENYFPALFYKNHLYFDFSSLVESFDLSGSFNLEEKIVTLDQDINAEPYYIEEFSTENYQDIDELLNDNYTRIDPKLYVVNSVINSDEEEIPRFETAANSAENNSNETNEEVLDIQNKEELTPQKEDNSDISDEDSKVQDEASKKAESEKERKEKNKQKLLENIKNIEPEIKMSHSYFQNYKWKEIDSLKFNIKNKDSYPEGTKLIVTSKYLDIDKDKKQNGYDISDEISINLSKKGKRFSDKRAPKIDFKLVFEGNSSDLYTYYYSPSIELVKNYIEESGRKNPPNNPLSTALKNTAEFYTSAKDSEEKFRPKEYKNASKSNFSNANGKSKKKIYPFVEISAPYFNGKYDKFIEIFSENANYFSEKYTRDTFKATRENYLNSPMFPMLEKLNPNLSAMRVSRRVLKKIKTDDIKLKENIDGTDYLFVYSGIGAFGNIQIDGKVYKYKSDGSIEDEPFISNLHASPRITKNKIDFTMNHINTLGFQAMAEVTGYGDFASWITKTKDEKVIDIGKFIAKSTIFSENFLELKLNKKEMELISGIMGIERNGVDIFKLNKALKNINEFVESPVNKNSDYKTLDPSEINSLIDDSLAVLKFAGKYVK